jgi:anti-anti-sigma factor
MQIETQIQGPFAILHVSGRLDAGWAEHFYTVVREAIREGHQQVRIHAAQLEYLSSAGIRSLLRIQRELDSVNGTFGIIQPSRFVEDTLRMSGMEQLLLDDVQPTEPATHDSAATFQNVIEPVAGIKLEVHSLVPNGRIQGQVHGNWKPWQPVSRSTIEALSLPAERFGLGIGAPGEDLEDLQSRLGEFAAAAGCVAWLPGDGSETPDFIEQADRFVPELKVIQALTGEGSFSHLIRFDPTEKGASLNLSDLFSQVLETTRSTSAALVALVEVEGLVGVSLLRSPGLMQASDHPEKYPQTPDWLSFCGDRVHRQSQALLISFMSRDTHHPMAPYLPELSTDSKLYAHTHAVMLPFRLLPQGIVDFQTSIRTVFDANEPTSLLHLITDNRPIIGLGQSAFTRGICWCAPLHFSTEFKS